MPRRKITVKKTRKIPKKKEVSLSADKVEKATASKKKPVKKIDVKELLRESRGWEERFDENKKEPQAIAPKIHKEMDESDKRIMMWAGVTFFMVLILFIWVLNIKSVFKKVETDKDDNSGFNWTEISDEFSETMSEIEKGLSELKEVELTEEEAGAGDNISEGEELELEKDEILELKNRLEELEEKMGE